MDFETADAINRAIRLIGLKHRALAADLLGTVGLHPGPEIVLLELDRHGPRTQSQLAAACACEPPTLTQLVQRLEQTGLIARHPSPTDARATLVELSAQGRALLGPLKERWIELAEMTVAGLSVTSSETLIAVSADLASGLSTCARRRRISERQRVTSR